MKIRDRSNLDDSHGIWNMKLLDHEVFDLEREKYVKQLPPKDASLTIRIQVESDKYLRLVPKLPLVLNKNHCMWNGTKLVHDQS